MDEQPSTATATATGTTRAPTPGGPTSPPKPRRGGAGSRPRNATRATFGSVRRLPSGRYQARYSDDGMNRYTAPVTFTSKRQAEDFLATIRADMVRGTWRTPELSAMTVAEYAGSLLAVRVDLAPKTIQLYGELLRLWIAVDLELPGRTGRRARTVNLGSMELGELTIAVIRDWYAAAVHVTDQRAAERERRAELRRRRAAVHAARAWAITTGTPVFSTGRLSAAVLTA